MKFLTITLLGLGTLSSFAQTLDADQAFLDSKYTHLVHPKVNAVSNKGLAKNDVASVIANQSSVKSQAARGTCSIFSATAYIEGLLIQKASADKTINLSEEWLQYTSVRGKSSDGSTAPANFSAIKSYGMVNEETLPYIGENWVEVYNSLKEPRCGHLKANPLLEKSCFIVHRDPSLLKLTDLQIQTTLKDEEFIQARKKALEFKKDNATLLSNTSYYLYNTDEVKEQLAKGNPVILEVDFYYGAWNHREADEFGIGRDLDQWRKGIVAYPEEGSADLTESVKHPAGHSILVVGYDDNKIVKKTIKMQDGTTKTFTYKGVYYFKNSWGTSSFGAEFNVDGVKYPGYGMMVYKYANEQGSFFRIPTEK
jgi:hypothetical protein